MCDYNPRRSRRRQKRVFEETATKFYQILTKHKTHRSKKLSELQTEETTKKYT